MAEKMRFELDNLETSAEGTLDGCGRKGEANVPVHFFIGAPACEDENQRAR
jgi:hypothetical protein